MRRVLLGAVAALLLVALVVAAAELGWAHANPLAQGSMSGDAVVCPGVPFDSRCTTNLPPPGDPFAFAFSVRNDGLLPLTILGASFEGSPTQTINIEGLRMMAADAMTTGVEASLPFEPFVLRQGEERELVAVAHVPACFAAAPQGSEIAFPVIDIGFRWLAVSQTQEVRLPDTLLQFPYTRSKCV